MPVCLRQDGRVARKTKSQFFFFIRRARILQVFHQHPLELFDKMFLRILRIEKSKERGKTEMDGETHVRRMA